MEWWIILLLFFGLFLLLAFMGTPIAFAFLVSNFIIIIIVMGFSTGSKQLVEKISGAVTNYSLTPVPLFVFMGELLFQSKIVLVTLNVFNKWLKKIPGRLSVLSIAGGTMFAALSGSSMANTSMLGSVLAPEMKEKGYHTSMSLGPIMGAGSLAMIIPPSTMIVILGGIASVSVGDLLIAGIFPGILLASLFILYIITACKLNPSLAPMNMEEKKESFNIKEFLFTLIFDISPLLIIIFSVVGFIILGLSTPTEAAAVGSIASLIVVILKRRLSVEVIKKTFLETLRVSGMLLLIVAASVGFGQLLSITGASRNLINFISTLNLSSISIIVTFLLIVFLLGFFIEPISLMMILVPVFLPILELMDINLVWFGIMMLITLDLGNITPPVGMLLFVMKGVRPEIPMMNIYKSIIPFVFLELLTIILLLAFPQIVLWLPSIGN